MSTMPPLRVILVDDEKNDYLITDQLLTEISDPRYVLDWASTYEEGKSKLASGKYDVCLLDYDLNGRNGLELQQETVAAGNRIPFILLTGRDQRSLDQEALLAGIADFLVKGKITAALLDRSLRYTIRQKRTEEALQDSQRRLDLALESADMGAWDLDLITNTTIRTLRHDQIFGYKSPLSEWGIEAFLDHVLPADRDATRRAFVEAFATHRFDMQCRIVWPDQSVRWIANRGKVFHNNKGEPTRMIGVVSDITAFKDTQEDLQKAKEAAERATRARSEFLANMSHEIRTPMNGVIGMTSLLLPTALQPQQRECVDIIHRSSETLLVLINDILDFSKIESGKIELEKQEFDLMICVQDALNSFKAAAQEKGITLFHFVHPGVPEIVVGDITRLRQILSNLIGNAVKFTAHGEIEVAMKVAAQPTPSNPEYCLAFSVHDTGIGIPADKRHRLFQTFSQVDASTTRQFGGTGLGLAISKRLCELMGGTIEVDSIEGQGTTFRFTIKAGVPTANSRPPSPAPAASEIVELGEPLSILLADDNSVNKIVAQRMLHLLGYQADTVSDGEAVIHAFAKRDYDVILMDVHMPKLDGIQATQQLRAQAGIRQPWIITLTASAMIGDREKCLAAGMNDYLSKPMVMQDLSDALCRAANKIKAQKGS